MKTGDLIRNLRTKKEISMSDLAKALGLSVQAISQYELNKREPSLEVLSMIADVLGVSTAELLNGGVSGNIDYSTNKQLAKKIRVTKDNVSLVLRQILFNDFSTTNNEVDEENSRDFKAAFSRAFLKDCSADQFRYIFIDSGLSIEEQAVVFALIRYNRISEFRVINFMEYIYSYEAITFLRPCIDFQEAFIKVYGLMGVELNPPLMDEEVVQKLEIRKPHIIHALNAIISVEHEFDLLPFEPEPGEYERFYYLYEKVASIVDADLENKSKALAKSYY